MTDKKTYPTITQFNESIRVGTKIAIHYGGTPITGRVEELMPVPDKPDLSIVAFVKIEGYTDGQIVFDNTRIEIL
ncbi:MAG: hypothetical protein A2418_00180 [Candidatus Brennerbacteria bacterium RIFOXYC1_FULL_41_11]|uniref:Uncharacterized protein n=1 Tax=Candidatus Brennerbacteria bacterium RIFOXYD1_FULL_41_16 TaxID=1797529 RepID=A0A1G1XJU5_9BACT|nr:MAG: hypothetical protein A2418_00180 [Candidatus Brennerbacteria bacterium RIFOXYC1_FULL_41_11]OGY40278.1 MAG: hypothetical protein A2570_03305 [Candidatus Brennerbacteria bacterium RIFOXYD1_FULL_41_16]